MKTIILLLVSTCICFQSLSQDKIKINDQIFDVVITDETDSEVFFYKYGDESKKVRSVPKKTVQEIIYEKYASPIYYTNVVEVQDASKKELQTRGKLWFAEAFRDSKEVIQVEDENQIIGKGLIQDPSVIIRFTVKLFFKEGRYKYEFSDFIHEGKYNAISNTDNASFGSLTGLEDHMASKVFGYSKNQWESYYKNSIQLIDNEIKNIASNLQSRMNQQTEANSDDW